MAYGVPKLMAFLAYGFHSKLLFGTKKIYNVPTAENGPVAPAQ
jgi:hypothetical protein